MAESPLSAWPEPGEPGQFTIRCSCGTWTFTGTAQEIQAASRSHDDSPRTSHIVVIARQATR